MLNFLKMAKILKKGFFLAKDYKDAFPVIELGYYGEKYGAYSLVYLNKGFHPPHIHDDAVARFYFIEGEGELIIGNSLEKIPFKKGMVYEVPSGTAHGFDVKKKGMFIAWQSKPITDHDAGTRDIRYPNN